MTHRERLEAKLEKRHEWAEKADVRSAARFGAATRLADAIPFGQPILVGHHSEKHHRRDLARIDSNMSKGVEESKLANHHRACVDGIERALDRSIFSDDDNAVEALAARIAEHEAKRERMKKINALYRKGNASGLAELGLDLESMRTSLNAEGVMSWCRIPYPAYELQNLGGRITADRKRLEYVKVQQKRAETADASGGVAVENHGEYCLVTFAEKPSRDILDALRAAGFRWGGRSWGGKRSDLPAGIVSEQTEEKS